MTVSVNKKTYIKLKVSVPRPVAVKVSSDVYINTKADDYRSPDTENPVVSYDEQDIDVNTVKVKEPWE